MSTSKLRPVSVSAVPLKKSRASGQRHSPATVHFKESPGHHRSRSSMLLILLGQTSITFAQSANTTEPSSTQELQEIIVTAEKRPERLQDTPVTMTVVAAQQLNDQHVTTIADLARTTPALEMIQSFGGPGGGGQIRGIGTQSFTRSAEGAVGVVLDGVSQGNVNIRNIFDVSQVEVLAGPQGTLFGLTSSAGVINMTTNAPNPEKFETIWHGDYADHGKAGSEFGQQALHGVVNIPLTGNSALRVAGSVDNYRGVEHNSFTGRDATANNYAVRGRYLWRNDVGITLNVIGDYQRSYGPQNGATAGFTYVYANPLLTSELAACGITPGWGNQDRCEAHANDASDINYGLSVQADWDFGSNTLTSISAYRRDRAGPISQDVQAEPLESPQLWSYGNLTDSRLYSEELRISSHPGTSLDYTAGLFYSNYLTSGFYQPGAFFHVQPVATQFFPPAPPGLGPPLGTVLLDVGFPQTALTETTNNAVAAFGQLTYHLTEQLNLIAGARYQHQNISDFESANGLSRGTAGDTSATLISLNQNNFSGKVGVQYKFNPDWTGYGTVTKGYKGFQAQAATSTTPAQVIPAEIPISYDLGIKGDAVDHRLGMDLSLFLTHVKNYQGQNCSLSAIGTLVCLANSFDVTTKGAQLDVFGHPLPNLTINAGFIYDLAEYPSSYVGLNPDNLTGAPGAQLPMGGLQLVGVPKEKLTLSADYLVPLGSVSWFVGSDAVYKSDVRYGYSPDPRFVYGAHWVVGVRTGIRSADGHWGVAVFGRDINNAHEPITLFAGPAFSAPGGGPFFNPAYPNGAVSGVSGWIGPQSLREVGISVDLKF